jgi:hypothetical protein
MRPVVIRALLFPFLIDSRQVGARRRSDARDFRERCQKFLIALPRCLASRYSATPRSLRASWHRCRSSCLNQAGRTQALQHPSKHRAMRFEIDQPTRSRNCRMVWWRSFQSDAETIAQRERVRRAPRDAALRIHALEIADQQQPKIDPWRQTGSAYRVGVERGALSFGEDVESMLAQQLIQARVERVTGGCREIRRRHPHARLPVAFPLAHGHARHCSTPTATTIQTGRR